MTIVGGKLVVLVAFFTLSGCQPCVQCARPASDNTSAVKNLVAALQQTGIFSTSLGYMQRDGEAGVMAFIRQVLTADAVTVFLPTDNAWKQVGGAKTRTLLQKRSLAQVFKYHMVRQYLPSRTLINAQPGSSLVTMEGSLLVKQWPDDAKQQIIGMGLSYDRKGDQLANGRGQTSSTQEGLVEQPDIYLDANSKISVQGFNAVLFPPDF